jgi:hypothetical protein
VVARRPLVAGDGARPAILNRKERLEAVLGRVEAGRGHGVLVPEASATGPPSPLVQVPSPQMPPVSPGEMPSTPRWISLKRVDPDHISQSSSMVQRGSSRLAAIATGQILG